MFKKKNKSLRDIINEITEIYPHMKYVATDDLEEPNFLFIGDEDEFDAFALYLAEKGAVPQGESNIDLKDVLERAGQKQITYDDDDEGNGGLLH